MTLKSSNGKKLFEAKMSSRQKNFDRPSKNFLITKPIWKSTRFNRTSFNSIESKYSPVTQYFFPVIQGFYTRASHSNLRINRTNLKTVTSDNNWGKSSLSDYLGLSRIDWSRIGQQVNVFFCQGLAKFNYTCLSI